MFKNRPLKCAKIKNERGSNFAQTNEKMPKGQKGPARAKRCKLPCLVYLHPKSFLLCLTHFLPPCTCTSSYISSSQALNPGPFRPTINYENPKKKPKKKYYEEKCNVACIVPKWQTSAFHTSVRTRAFALEFFFLHKLGETLRLLADNITGVLSVASVCEKPGIFVTAQF